MLPAERSIWSSPFRQVIGQVAADQAPVLGDEVGVAVGMPLDPLDTTTLSGTAAERPCGDVRHPILPNRFGRA
jgi:hypothetical protein